MINLPQYKRAIYANETATLENKYIRLDVHKRNLGWGWGEVYSPSGKLMCVFEYLGEIMIRDQDIPMRLEANEVKRESGDFGEQLSFHVKSIIVQEKLNGTSFANWMRYPFNEHLLEGEVTFTLTSDKPVIYMSYKLSLFSTPMKILFELNLFYVDYRIGQTQFLNELSLKLS